MIRLMSPASRRRRPRQGAGPTQNDDGCRRGCPGVGQSGDGPRSSEDCRNLDHGAYDLVGKPLNVKQRLARNLTCPVFLGQKADLGVLADHPKPQNPRKNDHGCRQDRGPKRPPVPAKCEIDEHGGRQTTPTCRIRMHAASASPKRMPIPAVFRRPAVVAMSTAMN